jgi:c-di-GMP-binding flagellar brake protein YcgR
MLRIGLTFFKIERKAMANTYCGPERRQSKRERMNCTVIYRVDQPLDTRFSLHGQDIHAKMVDISQNGMAMVTDRDIPIATVLSMRFTLLKVKDELIKFSAPMEITGEVRSNTLLTDSQRRLGIFFTKMRKVNLS